MALLSSLGGIGYVGIPGVATTILGTSVSAPGGLNGTLGATTPATIAGTTGTFSGDIIGGAVGNAAVVTLNRAVKLDSTTSGHKVGVNFSVADGVSNHRSVLYLDDATGDTVIDRASTSGAMQFKIRQNGIDQFALSTTGAATFSDDINIAAGKKLAYSATAYMTPENNSTGAEIATGGSLIVKTGGTTTSMTLDASGNLLVGTSVASGRLHVRGTGLGTYTAFFETSAAGGVQAAFYTGASGVSYGYGGASTAMYLGSDTGTGRSINAGGTINASGADYAEYEHNNGLTISKGSVVGFKADGTLTLTFNEAVRFAIKSTDPSYVGGDTWGIKDAVGDRPNPPADDADQEIIDQYESDIAVFEDALEAARQLVDRIAYSGKVPVNVIGATAGEYIIAAESGDGSITGVAVTDPDFTQYKLAVGRVDKIEDDGRARVAVIVH